MSSRAHSTRTAGVALVHREGDALRTFVTRRPDDRDFLGGFHGYFVGRAIPEDEEVPLARDRRYHSPDRRHWGCAARELFEESGLLPLERGLVVSWKNSSGLPAPESSWADFRSRVRRSPAAFASGLRETGLRLDTNAFAPVGAWPSPEWAPIQTRTEFFVCRVDVRLEELPEHLEETEHAAGTWAAPDRALAHWEGGQWFLSTPIRLLLEGLVRDDGTDDLLPPEEARDGAMLRAIEFAAGLVRLPLRTATLPPATHTNALVIGRDGALVVDPGSTIRAERDLLISLLERPEYTPRAVVLTHHHDDHTGAVPALRERFDLEVWAHDATRTRLDGAELVDRTLRDGDRLGAPPDRVEVMHTPGHTSGHLSLLHERTGVAAVGDLVASEGTILIDPEEGDMGAYMESLRRVDARASKALLPGHGELITDPHQLLEGYLRHRQERESRVLDALRHFDEPALPEDLVPRAYHDKPRSVWPLAARSLESHLEHLVARGLAEKVDRRYLPTDGQESDDSSV